MLKVITQLQKLAQQSDQDLRIMHSIGGASAIKVITHLQKTVSLSQKLIAQERHSAYQARRKAMQNRRPI